MQPLQLVKFAIAAGGLCCGGIVVLRASETPSPDALGDSTVHLIRTVRIVPDAPQADAESIPSMSFEERWPIKTNSVPPEPSQRTTAEPQTQAPKIRSASTERSDPVCGDKGRRYFFIDRHKYWKCQR
jgi:hypothetical protein